MYARDRLLTSLEFSLLVMVSFSPRFPESFLNNLFEETTAHTMAATLGFLGIYPEIQKEVYEEIIRVVGPHGEPVRSTIKLFLTYIKPFSSFRIWMITTNSKRRLAFSLKL